MKIVIAPDSFKGSLSAIQVADCMEEGIRRVFPEADVVKVPMADGGEGTVQALVDGTGGRIVRTIVKDPILKEIESFYGIMGDGKTAVIEMAAASGLTLVESGKRNPMVATTFGTGQLIKDALDKGCRSFILGIGGSATNDGGAGMASALGVKFLSKDNREIGPGGGNLGALHSIDTSGIDPRIKHCSFVVACDVDNPLCGPHGASCVYAAQKGADQEMIRVLDDNLAHYGRLLEKLTGKPIVNMPGAGAAGGLGAGAMAFLDAKLDRGIHIVIEATKLEQKLQGAALVFTGEGKMDRQTCFGKTPFGVAQEAQKYGIPVIGIAGGLDDGAEELYAHGFQMLFPIVDKPMSLDEAITNSEVLIINTAERIMRAIKTGQGLVADHPDKL